MASRFSVIDTGSPAARSSWTKPWRTSSIVAGASHGVGYASPLRAGRALGRVDQLLAGLGDVGLVLQQHVQRLADHLGRDLRAAEVDERAGPVDRLRDRRRLLQVELADRPHDARDLLGELVVDLGHPHPHDLLLALDVGVVDVQEEAAALQRLGELAGVVRREDARSGAGVPTMVPSSGIDTWKSESTSSRSASVSISTRSTSSISSTTGSSARIASSSGRVSRNGSEKMSASTTSHDGLVLTVGLDPQQLLLVVPLVERLGLVEALVALEPDQAGAGAPRRWPWPARSCRRRPGPRPAPASRAGRRGTRPRRCWRRRGSRRRAGASTTSSTDSNRSATVLSVLRRLSLTSDYSSLFDDLAVAPHDVLVRGQLAQAHRAARVQLLGRDPDLGAEAEPLAVGEAGRRVHDHDRGVDLVGERGGRARGRR